MGEDRLYQRPYKQKRNGKILKKERKKEKEKTITTVADPAQESKGRSGELPYTTHRNGDQHTKKIAGERNKQVLTKETPNPIGKMKIKNAFGGG